MIETLVLEPDPLSVRSARRFITGHLRNLAIPAEVVVDVQLATSELVTNGVVHARTPVTLTVSVSDRCVRVEAADRDRLVPRLRTEVGPRDIGGRGLRIIDAIASRWAVEARPDGKAVWFEVDLTAGEVGGHDRG